VVDLGKNIAKSSGVLRIYLK